MAKVQVLRTPGCTRCARAEKMLDKMNVKYEVIDITKNPKILQKYQVMTSPGIIIDEKLEFSAVPKEDELRKKFKL